MVDSLCVYNIYESSQDLILMLIYKPSMFVDMTSNHNFTTVLSCDLENIRKGQRSFEVFAFSEIETR